jgi:hypothetical protein
LLPAASLPSGCENQIELVLQDMERHASNSEFNRKPPNDFKQRSIAPIYIFQKMPVSAVWRVVYGVGERI